MNKIILTGTTLALLVTSVTPALAFDIKVQTDGSIHLYSNTVLGESTSSPRNATRPNQVIPAYRDQEIRVKTIEGHLMVESQDRNALPLEKPEIQEETSRVNLEYPTDFTATQERVRTEEQQQQFPRPNGEYLRQLDISRQERAEEQLEIRSRYDEQNRPELELRSRTAAARLRGAEFSYDQATNQVKVVTPSGEERTLNHLPDQALERFKAALAERANFVDEDGLEVTTTQDGKVLYKTKLSETKRLFGVLPRQVESEVTLEDGTGKVTTQEMVPQDLLGRLLYSLSY